MYYCLEKWLEFDDAAFSISYNELKNIIELMIALKRHLVEPTEEVRPQKMAMTRLLFYSRELLPDAQII